MHPTDLPACCPNACVAVLSDRDLSGIAATLSACGVPENEQAAVIATCYRSLQDATGSDEVGAAV